MSYLDTALKIIKKLNNNNFEAYIVGGYVRDYLLNNNPNDIDITTSALPSDIQKLFDKVIPTGIDFEGVTVVLDCYTFELTTFRKDLDYYDHRHPNVAYASSLEEDLARRDFTINAMCLDYNLNVIDLYNGKKDLNDKIIRTVGNPIKRFDEDALRMLRAFYFASKLNFDIDPDTLNGIEKNAKYIESVSGERIYNELSKLINSAYQMKGLKYLANSKLIKYLPSLEKGTCKIVNKNIDVILNEFYAINFYLSGYSNRYKLSNALAKSIKTIINYVDKVLDNYDIFVLDVETLKSINKVKLILDKDYQESLIDKKNNLVISNIKELDINAKDIISIGYEGKDIKDKLEYALRLVLDKKCENKKDKIIAKIK